MNERRRIWVTAHGPIPKGWLIHNLNGNKVDNRLENLAAIPRIPVHQGQITAPYVERIRNLERLLRQLEEK
jgi:hypothetical protein